MSNPRELPAEVAVVVLGAGPAGLTAAWELVEAGWPVLLVELDEAPGGLCRSFERNGFHFDLGGHRFITRNRELFERVRGLLGDELRVRERTSVIRIGGREYRYPLDPLEVLRGEGVGGVARILASWVAARLASRGGRRERRAGGDVALDAASSRETVSLETASLETWVRARFGGAIFERFFRDYTRKLWGVEASGISADWAGQRISQMSLKDFASRALGLSRRRPRTFAVKYCYPRHGIGQLFSAVASRCNERGAVLACGARAVSVRLGERPELVLRTASGEHHVRCEHVVSTIPLPELVDIAAAPDDVRAAAATLRFRALRFVNLLLDGPAVSDRTWIYVPDKEHIMTRVQFPANRSPENCPSDATSIQLEIPCDAGDAVWSADEDELRERCLRDLARLGIDVASRLRGSFSTRARHAYPVYASGYRQARGHALAWTDGHAALQTCGRQGRFDYIFFDRAMEHGLRAARRILGRPHESEVPESEPLLPDEAQSIVGE